MLSKMSPLGAAVVALGTFILVPLCLGWQGPFVMRMSIHIGAWLAGFVEGWGDTAGRFGMVMGTGVAMLVGLGALIGLGLGVAVALGTVLDRGGRWVVARLRRG
jgi:hypothetical protein